MLIGIALYAFGAEGVSTPALTDASYAIGPADVSGQSLCVALVCMTLVATLRWFFVRTLFGKALRAAASDRLGARLIGVDHALSGRAAFALASAAAAISGILIAPITPLSYDTGFEIGPERLRRGGNRRSGIVPDRRRWRTVRRRPGIVFRLLGE